MKADFEWEEMLPRLDSDGVIQIPKFELLRFHRNNVRIEPMKDDLDFK